MQHAISRISGVLLTAFLTVGAAIAAQPDVPGSRDPYRIDRFPRSWIVAYERDQDVVPRELVTSRVDRVRRDLRVDDLVQVDAAQEAVTYQIPQDVAVSEVFDHYRQELGGDELFTCEGRACGRSADWAHQVFEQSLLYGPDANQVYAAFEWQGLLVSLYVNERGNKRVYAHLRFLDPGGDRATEPNLLLVQRLNEHGWTVLEDVHPDDDGSLGPDGRRMLAQVRPRLDALAGERLYLVCHLFGPSEVEALLTASRGCAEQAVGHLTRGSDGAEGGPGPDLVPFGAGPLLPRKNVPASRIELVRPAGVEP